MKSLQTCHSTLNTRLINVARTLIIHVKDFLLLGVCNCQERREPLPPLPLFDGRRIPLGKDAEGQDLKDKRQKKGLDVHYDLLHPSSNTFKRTVFPSQPSAFSHPSLSFQTRPLPSLDFPLFFCPPNPPPPSPDSSFTSVWLPVGSSHGEMYERGENGWLIQSSLLFLRRRRVISGTAKAF